MLVTVSCGADTPSSPLPQASLLAASTVSAGADSLVADGASSATITVVLREPDGRLVGKSAGPIVLRANAGTAGAVFDHGDGTYSAVFTAPTMTGIATISATLKSEVLEQTATIALVPGVASPARTFLSVSVERPYADGVTGTQIFVNVRDANDNPTTKGIGPVTMATTTGVLGPLEPYSAGVGTYVATLTSDATGTATVSARINGIPLASSVTVQFVGGFWRNVAPLPVDRQVLGAGAINGILYAVGGGGWTVASYSPNLFAYDPATGRWASHTPMPTPRGELAAGVVGGKLYALGGYASGDLAAVEAYDPSTDSWSAKAPMPTPREGLAVGVINGILYAVGGNARGAATLMAATALWKNQMPSLNIQKSENALRTVEAYNPAADTWTTRAPMPTARSQLAVAVVNGILYAIGGQDKDTQVRSVEAYDPVANSWTVKASLPEPYGRTALAAAAVDGVVYAIGGFAGYEETDIVDKYDPVADQWSVIQSMPTKRQSLAVAVVNGLVYAVGGACYDDTLSAVEAFVP